MSETLEPPVGTRLRALREKQGWSLRELADRCGLSFNAISRIERGESSPMVSTLHLLATALDVSITAFFENGHDRTAVLTRHDQRLRSDAEGISMESLGIGLRNQQLEPFLVSVASGAGNMNEPVTHRGEEFVMCLEGTINYCINGETYALEAGDSLLFEATQPHCFVNTGEVTTQLLFVFQAADGHHLAGSHYPQT